MKCLIYNYTNPLDSLILAATAFVSKASDILNTYVIPYNVVKELTPKLANTADLSKISKSNCDNTMGSDGIPKTNCGTTNNPSNIPKPTCGNTVDPDKIPKPNCGTMINSGKIPKSNCGSPPRSNFEELNRMLGDLKRLYRWLLELLRDTSAAGQAKLRSLYEYILRLFEKLLNLDPDWTLFEISALIVSIMALIIMSIVAASPFYTFWKFRHERILKADRHRRWERAVSATIEKWEYELREIRCEEWKLNPLNPAREMRLHPNRLTSEEIHRLREMSLQAKKLTRRINRWTNKL